MLFQNLEGDQRYVSASDEFEFGGILDLLEQQQDLKRILFAFYIFPPESQVGWTVGREFPLSGGEGINQNWWELTKYKFDQI